MIPISWAETPRDKRERVRCVTSRASRALVMREPDGDSRVGEMGSVLMNTTGDSGERECESQHVGESGEGQVSGCLWW